MAKTIGSQHLRHLQTGLNSNTIGGDIATAIDKSESSGVVPLVHLTIDTNPTVLDTVTIGADTYEFLAAGGTVSDDSYIAVVREASTSGSRTNLQNAANASTPNDEHPTCFKAGGVIPARANGVEPVTLFGGIADDLYIANAERAGGTLLPANPDSLAMSETFTAVSNKFDVASPNLRDVGGVVAGPQARVAFTLTVTAGMIAGASMYLYFGFVPEGFHITKVGSGPFASILAHGTDAYISFGGGLVVLFAGGASPAIQAGDVLHITAWAQAS